MRRRVGRVKKCVRGIVRDVVNPRLAKRRIADTRLRDSISREIIQGQSIFIFDLALARSLGYVFLLTVEIGET